MNINKRLLILFLSLIGLSTFAQTAKKSLNYQAVILDPKAIDIPGASIVGQPLNKGNVCLRFSLLNAQGGVDYEETQQVTTDEYGLVNVAIGTGTQVSSNSIYKSFENIAWNASVKSLKVSVSYDGCSSFKQVSTQALNYTPYSLYAEAVEYKNVREAPTKLSQFSNDSGYLIPKDLDPIKSDVSKNTADIKTNTSQIATANQTIADNKKSSDAAFLIANQNITSLDTKVAANTTAIKENTSSINTINTKLVDQQNQISDNRNQISSTNNNLSNQIGGLQGQINTTNSTVSNLSGSAELVSNKSTETNLGGANPSDQLYPSQKAAKAYVDNAIYAAVGTGVADATTLAPGKVQLSGDLGGTAALPTVPALANKENTSNKSTNVQTDGADNNKYPTVKAVKDYVDQATAGIALQATVDGKADKASPTFTGTPVLPTGTVGVTQPAIDNSTKLATTAFVQQATAGIALQAAVDLKAPLASPTFTGTPSLPAGTTAVTQAANDNSTKLATTEFVNTSLAAGAPNATTLATGKIQLAGELSGTATSPSLSNGAVIGKVLTGYSSAAGTLTSNDNILQAIQKLNGNDALLAPLSSPTFTGTPSLPTGTTAVTQATNDNSTKLATTEFVNTSLATGAPDATTLATGKIQLAGELSGTATSPTLSNSAVIGKVLTGYSSSAGTLTSGDNILQAIQKLNGNDALLAPLSSPTFTGTPSLPTGTTAVTQATNDNSTKLATTEFVKSSLATGAPDATTLSTGKIQLAGELSGTATSPTLSNSAVIGKLLTGYSSGAGTITATDNILEAIQKLNGNDALKAPLASPTLVTPVLGVATATSINSTTIPTSKTLVVTTDKLNVMAATTSAELAGVISDETGTGVAVLATSPTLVTPVLGVATGTSLSVSGQLTSTVATGTAPLAVTSTTPVANLSIGGNAETATTATNATNTAITDDAATATAVYPTFVTGNTGNLPQKVTSTKLSFVPSTGVLSATSFAGSGAALTGVVATTNANLTGAVTSSGNATSIASQTGTGSTFVMDTSPTLVTPTIGEATATSVNKVTITAPTTSATLTIANGKTLTSNNSLTLAGTDATTMTFPTTDATIARTDAAQTFTGTQTFVGTVTGTPTSSAALDVTSTSQGFLPPRMTTSQRDAISSPVEGLTIWNKTNKQLEVYDGSYWVNMIGKLVSTLNIGDSYGGGKVAYIFTSSDPGYIAGQTHGLIAASSDQTTDLGVKWFPYTFYGATGTYLGLGLPNTVSIIASAVLQGSTDISTFAAGLASSHRGGGYIDWYLPSKDELNKLYANRVAIGGFATSGTIATYWSSSQKGSLSYTDFNSLKTGVASAYQQFFFAYNGNSEGTQNDLGISNLRRVRAVRTF